jgi:hypothetical protein
MWPGYDFDPACPVSPHDIDAIDLAVRLNPQFMQVSFHVGTFAGFAWSC